MIYPVEFSEQFLKQMSKLNKHLMASSMRLNEGEEHLTEINTVINGISVWRGQIFESEIW